MIKEEVIDGFFSCPLKAYYLQVNELPVIFDYKSEISRLKNKLKQKYAKKWRLKNSDAIQNKNKETITIPSTIEIDGMEIKTPLFEHSQQKLIPVFISYDSTISKEKRHCFSFKVLLLARYLNISIDSYKVTGVNLKTRYFKITDAVASSEIIDAIKNRQPIVKKKHCFVCEFQSNCRKELIEKNDLRLLSSMTEEEVLKWNEKGYFSVIQLSYKYKPRKSRILPKSNGRYKFELKALAIRENKTFVLTIPEIGTVSSGIYYDFESLPNEHFVYLIGLIITDNEKIKHRYSFWANSYNEEIDVFENFFKIIRSFPNLNLYHYGNFEIKELIRFNKKHIYKYDADVNYITKKSVNILSYFYSDVFPPTYSNGLKEISNNIGFFWRKDFMTGLKSIAYRKKWENDKNSKSKHTLIEYNQSDCEALFLVSIWLKKISLEQDSTILEVKDIANKSTLKFGKTRFIIDSFNSINDKAYFNYQHSKIFFRKKPVRSKPRQIKRSQFNIRANTTKVSERPEHCTKCNNERLYIHQKYNRTLIDLKFTQNGIKRWVTNFKGYRFRCSKCGNVFTDPKYYKQPTFGMNVQIWIIYNYMAYGISYGDLAKMLMETFKIEVTRTYVSSIKPKFAKLYSDYYSNILESIINGEVLHIDETSVKTQGTKGYVWVLTNFTNVYYIYRKNRESNFLTELIRDFKGVLISDFYAGYDSLKCKQQKCLIHLIRDINDLYFKNQQNIELQSLAVLFGNLMRKIISTIDKYGLRYRNLKKHNLDVERFYQEVDKSCFNTDVARKLVKRLVKNKDRIFLFLNFDNIPWNNNNAEFAIKAFAKYRKKVDGIYNEKGLSDYLTLLSVSQTCHYRGESFLEFLINEQESTRDNNKYT
ncbi:TM0106 family RecB-like putative nuclease [Arenibacter latericius]|uniref:TM0106 family RecB-like putative nuclease n=1 Tax=Arenibacter latericius TaxID=86104 RepID=UPI000412557A|nr:TM0106 family RecB-like putative nuclease [Arenibacter latericius]